MQRSRHKYLWTITKTMYIVTGDKLNSDGYTTSVLSYRRMQMHFFLRDKEGEILTPVH